MATYSSLAVYAARKFDQNGTSDDSLNSVARGATGGSTGAGAHVALHLASAATSWMSSLAALPFATNGSLPWKEALKSGAIVLASILEEQSPEALSAALGLKFTGVWRRLHYQH